MSSSKPCRTKLLVALRTGFYVFALVAVCWLGFSSFKAFSSGTPLKKTLNLKPIPRIRAGTMEATEFFERFHDTPVIIEGEVRHHPAYTMQFEGLKKLCGESIVTTGVYSKDSGDWGGLVDILDMPLEEYIDSYILRDAKHRGKGEKLRYASAGTGLPTVCPALQLFAPVPKYFTNGLEFVTDPSLYKKTGQRLNIGQPEIFVGAKDTLTEIHMDNIFTPFWMTVYMGSKTFRLITYEDGKKHLSLDKPSINFMMNGTVESKRYQREYFNRLRRQWETKQLEIWNPDFEAFPDLEHVPVLEGTVRAGDVLYLPSATLHGVHNKENSFGMSINAFYPKTVERYIRICADETNFALNCKDVASGMACGIDDDDVKTKSQLEQCLLGSPQYKEAERKHEAGEAAREMYLHEMQGYTNHTEWCYAVQSQVHDWMWWENKDGYMNEEQLEAAKQALKFQKSQCSETFAKQVRKKLWSKVIL